MQLTCSAQCLEFKDSSHVVAVVQLCLTLCDPMDCSTPGFSALHYLLEFAQTHVHWIHDAIQPSVTPFSSCLQSFQTGGSLPMSHLFTSGAQSIGASAFAVLWNEYSRLTSFRIDWLDVLALQETLKSLLQHHSSKASIL